MTVKVLVNEKNQRLSYPAISISKNQKKLTLNQPAFCLLMEEYGKDSQYAQILFDDEDNAGIFWIKLSDGTSIGSRKLDLPSKHTRTCSIGNLIEVLNWTNTNTTKFELIWDDQIDAGKVDTNKPLNFEER